MNSVERVGGEPGANAVLCKLAFLSRSAFTFAPRFAANGFVVRTNAVFAFAARGATNLYKQPPVRASRRSIKSSESLDVT